MITSNYQVDGDIYSYADKFFCDSHDDKPSNADAPGGLINGAILEETNTGKTYIFDKKANEWTEKAAGGGGSTTLAGLTDVDISNPSDGQMLAYNSTTHKWENAPPSTLLVSAVNDETTQKDVLSETWQTIDDAIVQGRLVIIAYLDGDELTGVDQYFVGSVFHDNSGYKLWAIGVASGQIEMYAYGADSPNDYPVSSDA